eukprot:12778374-Heterocapsa_arctica.AAC.1
MWYVPELIKLALADHVTTVVSDFCQYGKRWRKRTRFLCGNIDPSFLHRMDRQCQGRHGVCSKSHQLHFQLTGSSPQGIPWTRIAQPYPPVLCHALAHALTSSAQA